MLFTVYVAWVFVCVWLFTCLLGFGFVDFTLLELAVALHVTLVALFVFAVLLLFGVCLLT